MTMSNTRWGILYCPKHGVSGAKKRWSKIESSLKSNGIDFDFVQCDAGDSVSGAYETSSWSLISLTWGLRKRRNQLEKPITMAERLSQLHGVTGQRLSSFPLWLKRVFQNAPFSW